MTRLDEPPPIDFVGSPSPKGLGGANAKSLFVDERGNTWLFKPQTPQQAMVDVVASRIAAAAGVPSPRVYARAFYWKCELKHGSIQPLVNAQLSKLPRDLTALTDAQRQQLQEHHVVDWLLGN